MLFDLEIQAWRSIHIHTHRKRPPRLPQAALPPSPLPHCSGGLPSLQESNPLREFPEPSLGEGRKVKSVHRAFFLAPLRSRQGKGSGVSGFKGSPGKAASFVAAPLREMRAFPFFSPPSASRDINHERCFSSGNGGGITVVWFVVFECVSFGDHHPPAS